MWLQWQDDCPVPHDLTAVVEVEKKISFSMSNMQTVVVQG